MEPDFNPDDLPALANFMEHNDGQEIDDFFAEHLDDEDGGNETDDSSSSFEDEEAYQRFVEEFRGSGADYNPPDSDFSDEEENETDQNDEPMAQLFVPPAQIQTPTPGLAAGQALSPMEVDDIPPIHPPTPVVLPPQNAEVPEHPDENHPINVYKPGDKLPKDSAPVMKRMAEGLETFRCDLCFKRYCRQGDLAVHKQNYHYKLPQFHKCTKCGRDDFKHRSVMQYHFDHAQCERVWEPGIGAYSFQQEEPAPAHTPREEYRNKTPLALFLTYFLPIMRIWLPNMNKRGDRLFQDDDQVRKKARKWADVIVREALNYVKLVLAWSLVSYKTLRDPWRRHKLFNNKFFSETMSGNRFVQIQRATCFCDPDICQLPGGIGSKGSDNYHPFWRVIGIMNAIVGPSQRAMQIGQLLVVDETMIKFEGHNKFVSYMPAKPVHQGFKFFILCDPETGYLYNLLPCCGKEYSEAQNVGLLNGTVIELLTGESNPEALNFLGKGHIVVGDNLYSDFSLIEWLKQKLTYYIGTMRRKRRVPDWMEDLVKHDRTTAMERGSAKYAVSNSGIQLVTWFDSKRVTIASTVPHIKGGSSYCWRRMVDKISRVFLGFLAFIQPHLVAAYNKWMGGVDLMNQIVSNYDHHFKCRRWTLCIFMRLLNFCVFNSFVIWKYFNRKTKDPKNQWSSREFRLFLINELDANLKDEGQIDLDESFEAGEVVYKREPVDWTKHRNAVPVLRDQLNKVRKSAGHPCCRFDRGKVCMVCKDKNRKTNFGCQKCKVTLHEGCFEHFHLRVRDF